MVRVIVPSVLGVIRILLRLRERSLTEARTQSASLVLKMCFKKMHNDWSHLTGLLNTWLISRSLHHTAAFPHLQEPNKGSFLRVNSMILRMDL